MTSSFTPRGLAVADINNDGLKDLLMPTTLRARGGTATPRVDVRGDVAEGPGGPGLSDVGGLVGGGHIRSTDVPSTVPGCACALNHKDEFRDQGMLPSRLTTERRPAD